MALNNLILDDKSWAALIEETRFLIPTFAPTWTDHNASDPGIAFIELFAWLEEMQRYRLNRTSSRTRQRFFAMAGTPAYGPRAASTVVEFSPPKGLTIPYIQVPAGETLSITAHLDVPYQTVRDVYLVPAALASIHTIAEGRELDRTAAVLDPAGHFEAFGANPRAGDALVIEFDKPIQAPEFALAFRTFDDGLPELPKPDRGGKTGPLPIPSVQLRWEFSGASPAWQPVATLDSTAALMLNGFVTFRNLSGPVSRIQVTIVSGAYEIPPRLASIRLNAIEVRQLGFAAPELDPGTGFPDQSRTLTFLPLAGSKAPVVRVGSPGLEEDWTQIDDLADSLPDSKHYTFDSDAGEIHFGNGFNGRVPGVDERIFTAPYLYTLGDKGNLAADRNWRLNLTGASAWPGTNPVAATDGADAEPRSETELRARREFRRSSRGVTAEDLARLAKETPGIRVLRAEVLAGRNPTCNDTADSGDITLVIVPAALPDQEPHAPSAGFLRTVLRHLQFGRLVANQLHVIGPDFVSVRLEATLTLKKRASETEVRAAAESELRKFFSAREWPLGRGIFRSEVHQLLAGVPGVAFASKVQMNGAADTLKLRATQLPCLDSIVLNVPEAQDE